MLYPVYVHLGDEQHAHGVTIPDFPGCFSAADEWEDLPRMINEAIDLYCEGEDMTIPVPTPLEKLAANPDYMGGVWLLVEVDASRLGGKDKVERVNITLPSRLLRRIDAEAEARHESRSGFLAAAALKALSKNQAA